LEHDDVAKPAISQIIKKKSICLDHGIQIILMYG